MRYFNIEEYALALRYNTFYYLLMLGIVFTGGERPEAGVLKKIARAADILVAADSGLMAMEEAGIKPDWIVGDMDSLDDPARLNKYPAGMLLRFPPEKDFTDTELALNLLKDKGCDKIWIAGGGGGRLDHLFAIRALFEREDSPDRWLTGNEEIRCLKDGELIEAKLPRGSLVSVFPLGEQPWQAESSGLKWPLRGLAWNKGGLGLSNAAQEGSFKIRSVRGRFLVIMPLIFDNI